MIILRVAVDVPLPKLFDYRSEDCDPGGYRLPGHRSVRKKAPGRPDLGCRDEIQGNGVPPLPGVTPATTLVP